MTADALPADAQQIHDTSDVWTFLDEAPDPDRVAPDALIVAGDAEDPCLARVVDIVDRPGGRKGHLDIVGVPRAAHRRAASRRSS